MTSDEAREYVVRRGWVEHRPAWWSHPDRPDPAETSLSGAVEFERRRDAGRAAAPDVPGRMDMTEI